MTTPEPRGGMLGLLPARYSKFVTALIGLAITYLTIYGTVWHLDPALVMIGTALGVYGVPNGPPPALPVPVPAAVTEIIASAPVLPAARPTQDVPPPAPVLAAEPGDQPEVIPPHV